MDVDENRGAAAPNLLFQSAGLSPVLRHCSLWFLHLSPMANPSVGFTKSTRPSGLFSLGIFATVPASSIDSGDRVAISGWSVRQSFQATVSLLIQLLFYRKTLNSPPEPPDPPDPPDSPPHGMVGGSNPRCSSCSTAFACILLSRSHSYGSCNVFPPYPLSPSRWLSSSGDNIHDLDLAPIYHPPRVITGSYRDDGCSPSNMCFYVKTSKTCWWAWPNKPVDYGSPLAGEFVGPYFRSIKVSSAGDLHSGIFSTSLFHRGNGIPHVKWLHLFFLTGFLPVRCRALSKGSYEVIEKFPLSLEFYKRWACPNMMLGFYDPTRSIFFRPFSFRLKFNPVDDFASFLTRMIISVRTIMIRNGPLSSILSRMVVTLVTVPNGTKSILTDLLAFVDVSGLEVAIKLVSTSFGGRISFTKSLWHVIKFRASVYVVESRLTHPNLVSDPLSFIFCDDHSIFSYAFIIFMYFALRLEDYSLFIFVLLLNVE